MRYLASPSGEVSSSSPNGEAKSEDEWQAIPDTNYKAKFDAWVKDKIGLDYETFTSSVLLLTGEVREAAR